MTTLNRFGSIDVTFSAEGLNAILLSLQTTTSHHQVSDDIAYVFLSTRQLLIMDLGHPANRKLFELFSITIDETNPYNVRFTQQAIEYTLNEAYTAVGYNSMQPVTDLNNVYIARYSNLIEVVDTSSNLVLTGGGHNGAAATLRNLAAGNGCTLDVSTTDATINVTPVTIVHPLPNYATSTSSNGAYADITTHSSTNVLAFNPPFSFTTQNFQNVDLLGIPYPSVNVSHVTADVYTKAESDGRYLQGVSFPLSNYGVSTDTTTYENTTVHSSTNVLSFMAPLSFTTTNYQNKDLNSVPYSSLNVSYVALDTSAIQTMIDTSVQAALDNITFSSNFGVDRSTPLALSIADLTPLFSHIPITTSINSQDVFIGSGLGLDVANKSWTFKLDIHMNPNQWHEVMIYANSQRNIGPWTNYRIIKFFTQYNTMKLQMNQPSGGQDIVIPTSAVTANDWNAFKLTYNSSNYIWTLTINGVHIGAVAAQAWAADTIQDILLYETNGQVKTRNVYIYDGLA